VSWGFHTLHKRRFALRFKEKPARWRCRVSFTKCGGKSSPARKTHPHEIHENLAVFRAIYIRTKSRATLPVVSRRLAWAAELALLLKKTSPIKTTHSQPTNGVFQNIWRDFMAKGSWECRAWLGPTELAFLLAFPAEVTEPIKIMLSRPEKC
jgi:hypothetical protein